MSRVPAAGDDDWLYCQAALRAVSRTFSRPIELLREELRGPVTCAYLLCRVADTVEDHPALSPSTRDLLHRAFLEVLEGGAHADLFAALYAPVDRGGADGELCRNLGRVVAVYRRSGDDVQRACTPWIAEMTRGMALYGHRPPGPDGLVALRTLADLERYCYYVAGTVGHLLTELFVRALPELAPAARHTLERQAEEFGLALQLVNVLKDITDDRERRVSYVPRSLVREAGLELAQMTDPVHREAAHRALSPVFERAHAALDAGLEYALALPPDARDVRLFCLLPLWMAARTLELARGNDAQLRGGAPVKITREEVFALIADCEGRVGSDEALREGWARLRRAAPAAGEPA